MSAGTDERSPGLGVATGAVVAVGTLGIGLQLETVTITPTTIGGAVGVVAVGGVVAAGLGALHRWYATTRIPESLAILVGTSVVAAVFNTTGAIGQALGGSVISVGAAVLTLAGLGAGAVSGAVGGRAGDRLARALLRTDDLDVNRLVAAVGRTIVVRLPPADEIENMPDYDPVSTATKTELAGRELTFPRRLTVAELRERLVERLRTDFGVGRVDVELDETGAITYLALGARIAGLGPTLPPGSAAVAIKADPALAASPGDIVQVWTRPTPSTDDGHADGGEGGEGGTTENGAGGGLESGSAPERAGIDGTVANTQPPIGGTDRVATGEVRGVAGETVTLAVDDADAERLADDVAYRLVTLPGSARADRAFASVLREADETMALVTIEAASPLVDLPVGALSPTVIAIRTADGTIEAIPSRRRPLTTGDAIYVVARPEAIRRLQAAAAGADGTAMRSGGAASGGGPASAAPDDTD